MGSLGIYAIINIIDDKCYVGSAVSFKNRWKNHRIGLRLNQHYNKHLQAAHNKYGCENFIYMKLEVVSDKHELIKREQYWIDTLKPEYNKAPTAGSALGIKHSAETIAKWSAMRKGQKRSDEFKLATSLRQKGKIVTDEAKANMSKSHMGETRSEKFKTEMSARLKGNQFNTGRKQLSEEIEVRRKANTGKKRTAETLVKMSEAQKGRTFTAEHRAKLSEARKKYLTIGQISG